MALDILEWGVILVMGAGILIWGPDKIPELAKTLARAKKEFDGATKQLQGITKELQSGISSGNLNLDTLSNAIISSGAPEKPGSIPGNPTPEAIAQASASSTTSTVPSGVVPVALPPPPKKSADQMLIEMARTLNIPTHGKTKEEISQAIMEVAATKSAQVPASAQAEPAPVQAAPPNTDAVAFPSAVSSEAVPKAESAQEAVPADPATTQ